MITTLSNQNIEGHICINYNSKVLDFKDKDCAIYVHSLIKLLKECREHLKYIVICPQNKKIIDKINQALGEDKMSDLAERWQIEDEMLEKEKLKDKPKQDCRTLAQKLLQVKPELREWLEVNFKEYL